MKTLEYIKLKMFKQNLFESIALLFMFILSFAFIFVSKQMVEIGLIFVIDIMLFLYYRYTYIKAIPSLNKKLFSFGFWVIIGILLPTFADLLLNIN